MSASSYGPVDFSKVGKQPPDLTACRLEFGPPGTEFETSVFLLPLSWDHSDQWTFIDPLPLGAKPGPGPYGKFEPWNKWLGEQLMYIAKKGDWICFTDTEIREMIAVANFGALFPGVLKGAAVPYSPPPEPSDDEDDCAPGEVDSEEVA